MIYYKGHYTIGNVLITVLNLRELGISLHAHIYIIKIIRFESLELGRMEFNLERKKTQKMANQQRTQRHHYHNNYRHIGF